MVRGADRQGCTVDLGQCPNLQGRHSGVAILGYTTPWCTCQVVRGGRVRINGASWLVVDRWAGVAEDARLVVSALAQRWQEPLTAGTLAGCPLILAVRAVQGEGPGIVGDACDGDWRQALDHL